jgi:hypothetical protein
MSLVRRAREALLRGGVREVPRNARRIARAGIETAAPVLPAAIAVARGRRDHPSSQLLVPKYLARPAVGMTTPNEQAYFDWYARQLYTGRGAIVDLGCWLGSTTIPLARGLQGNRTTSGVVHAYDQFIWEPWMAETSAGAALRPRPHERESFQGAFEQLTAPWSGLIVSHAADLSDERWDGGPIEFLLVDAMKSWALSDAIVQNFFPSMLPGGFILHQDFSHYYTPWVHLVSHRLRDCLRPAYDVPRSASTVFEVIRPIDVATLRGEFSRAEVDAAFAWSMDLTPGDKHPAIAASKIKHLLDQDGTQVARNELSPWLERHPGHVELVQVLALIDRADSVGTL